MKKLTAIVWFAACVLAACGSDDETSTPTTAQPTAPKPQAAKPADPTAKMAHAVPSGKSGAAVDLKYDVLNKPEPGKPIELDLALMVGAVTDSMTVAITATPGLEVVANATGNFGALKTGEIAHHKITVRAEHAEVVYLTVTATLYALNVSSVRTFAIPLIFTEPAGAGAPTATAQTVDGAAKQDAGGQKTQSLPAQESK